MKREDVLIWLNRRLNLANKKQFNNFDHEDYIFIRNYIHVVSNKIVPVETIFKSMTMYPFDFVSGFIDNMTNNAIRKFNIKIEWEELKDPIRNVIGQIVHSHKVKSYS